MTRRLRFETAWIAPGRLAHDVVIDVDASGTITALTAAEAEGTS